MNGRLKIKKLKMTKKEKEKKKASFLSWISWIFFILAGCSNTPIHLDPLLGYRGPVVSSVKPESEEEKAKKVAGALKEFFEAVYLYKIGPSAVEKQQGPIAFIVKDDGSLELIESIMRLNPEVALEARLRGAQKNLRRIIKEHLKLGQNIPGQNISDPLEYIQIIKNWLERRGYVVLFSERFQDGIKLGKVLESERYRVQLFKENTEVRLYLCTTQLLFFSEYVLKFKEGKESSKKPKKWIAGATILDPEEKSKVIIFLDEVHKIGEKYYALQKQKDLLQRINQILSDRERMLSLFECLACEDELGKDADEERKWYKDVADMFYAGAVFSVKDENKDKWLALFKEIFVHSLCTECGVYSLHAKKVLEGSLTAREQVDLAYLCLLEKCIGLGKYNLSVLGDSTLFALLFREGDITPRTVASWRLLSRFYSYLKNQSPIQNTKELSKHLRLFAQQEYKQLKVKK